jgi:putative PIG3 family NAD(P)H quinone oxidoreductase
MKAILITHPGGSEVLMYGEAPDPQIGPDDLLVRVHATAVNRADVAQREGNYPPPANASPILGLEIAGEVIQKGIAAGSWQVGDRVMAVITGGGYAELAVVPAGVAIRIPDVLSYEQAAAIPEAFLTAYLNLFALGRLQSGETALIHAGASGVGTAAIQLAHSAGAYVITTAGSDEKLAVCRALGAATTINYKSEAFADSVLKSTNRHGADVILDFIGAAYWNDNLKAAAIGGRLLLIGMLGGASGQLDIGMIMYKQLTVMGTTLRRTPLPQKITLTAAFADYALPRFENGELRPVIDSVYPLTDVANAHRLLERNGNTGKIVLRVS